jgi:predicted anti-sigma-YlaC factor YlaD
MIKDADIRDLLDMSGSGAVDSGCAASFEMLHRYVELELAGGPAEKQLPGVAAHLRRCPACRTDYLGLVEAVRLFGDDDPEPDGR